MSRPPVRDYFRIRAWEIYAENQRLTAADVVSVLDQEGHTDTPSPRWVSEQIRAFKGLPAEEQMGFRTARWPEICEHGFVPWEAGCTILELMRLSAPTPSTRLAKWYWRVTLAVPDAPYEDRSAVSQMLAAAEALGNEDRLDNYRRAEDYLRAMPWQSEEARNSFFSYGNPTMISVSEGTSEQQLQNALQSIMAPTTAKAVGEIMRGDHLRGEPQNKKRKATK